MLHLARPQPLIRNQATHKELCGSLQQDEVLAHRLGLVPIMADPRLFWYKVRPLASRNANPWHPTTTAPAGTLCQIGPTNPSSAFLGGRLVSRPG